MMSCMGNSAGSAKASIHHEPYPEADEALIDKLVVSGHPSTPGFNDPAYPIEGRRARTA
jgi:hypothetical protein